MKELRASVSEAQLRVLFVFDPFREAILILGGDKRLNAQWNEWYETNIPIADDLYSAYLTHIDQTEKGTN